MQEIINKRGWDFKLFDTGRFKEELPIYGTKIQNGLHDVEPDGSFVECEPSMRDYIGNVSTLEAIRGRYGHLRAGDTGSESKDRIKILTKRNCGISLKLSGYRTYGPWDDTTKKIRFDTDDGITLNYYPSYKGVNIVITVDNPQAASNIITFSLKEYGCDYTYEEKDGNIIARSSNGEDDIYINALYAIDANGDSGNVSLRLGNVIDGYQRIEKVIEPVWFGNAIGPVEIDPSVTIDDDSGTLNDLAMITGAPNNNYGGAPWLNCQRYGAGDADSTNFLMYVDLSAYPNITVTSAKFGVDVYAIGGSNTIDYYKVLVDWVEGTANGSVQAGSSCWAYRISNTDNWNSAGCQGSGSDHEAIKDGSVTITAIDSDFPIPLTNALVQDWSGTPANNRGIVSIKPDIQNGIYSNMRSSEATLGNKPYFYMEYTEGDGAISHYVAFSIYDKQFNAFKELSGKNTII